MACPRRFVSPFRFAQDPEGIAEVAVCCGPIERYLVAREFLEGVAVRGHGPFQALSTTLPFA